MPEQAAVKGGVKLSVDVCRRHVLMSRSEEAAQAWASPNSTLCQIGCCQGLHINESSHLRKESKQRRPRMMGTFLHSIYTISY